MALRQLLIRLWVTDHGDCHFREESLEKVTVLTSKRHKDSVNPVNLVILDLVVSRWAGARRAASLSAFLRLDLGVLKRAPMTNGCHVSFN